MIAKNRRLPINVGEIDLRDHEEIREARASRARLPRALSLLAADRRTYILLKKVERTLFLALPRFRSHRHALKERNLPAAVAHGYSLPQSRFDNYQLRSFHDCLDSTESLSAMAPKVTLWSTSTASTLKIRTEIERIQHILKANGVTFEEARDVILSRSHLSMRTELLSMNYA